MMRRSGLRARWATVLGLVALAAAACGTGSPTPAAPSGIMPVSSADRPAASSAAPSAPSATPAPSPPDEPGLVIDRSFAWGTIAWSPNGSTLAAAALSQPLGQGEIHLFERSGRQAGVIPGIDLTWIDDDHLVAVERNSDGVSSSARLWSKDARESQLLAARMSSILGNGHGATAILYDTQDAAPATYRIWTAGVLSKALRGVPVAWSPDGRLMVVEHEPGATSLDGRRAPVPGSALAAGGSIPAWFEVVDYPGLRRVAAFRDVLVDGRVRPSWDPAGVRIAAPRDDGRVVVLQLASRAVATIKLQATGLGWTPDGRLVLETGSPHEVRLWDPATQTVGAPLPPGDRVATVDGQVVTVPDPSLDPAPEVRTTGALTPDGSLRARSGPAIGDETLRLLPEVPVAPAP